MRAILEAAAFFVAVTTALLIQDRHPVAALLCATAAGAIALRNALEAKP